MARSRNIKPGFFKNEQLGECSDGARLLFIGLWTLADFRGVLEWRPKKIHAELFPYDRRNVSKLVAELEAQNLVIIMQKNDKSYLLICGFNKHQNPHRKERERGTDLPDPCEFRLQPGQDPVQDGVGTKPSGLIPDSLIPDPDSLKENSRAFEDFWKKSPRTGSKKKALEQWTNLAPEDRAVAYRAVMDQTLARMDWTRVEPEHFIPDWPHMFRWLRDKRFNDEPDKPKTVGAAPSNIKGGKGTGFERT